MLDESALGFPRGEGALESTGVAVVTSAGPPGIIASCTGVLPRVAAEKTARGAIDAEAQKGSEESDILHG